MNEQQLLDAALAVRNNAYAPYSKFAVGCALVTKSGIIYTGCNVENSSFGLSICAERSAIVKMVAEGHREIDTIVVAASPLASPCGACRQFIVEFGTRITIISANAERPSERQRWEISDLLPQQFHFPADSAPQNNES